MAAVLEEQRHGTTGLLVLDRPEARNALNSDLLDALPTALTGMESDPEVSVVVLTGRDPAFCAGLDLKELRATGANRRLSDTGRGPFLRIGKPVIGAINGAAVTGGLELALRCDALIASHRATFADTHTRVGLVPRWGMTTLLPDAIGDRRARLMSLSGTTVDAETALLWGLVDRVVDHEELLPAAFALADEIAATDPRARSEVLATYEEAAMLRRAPGAALEMSRAIHWRPGGT